MISEKLKNCEEKKTFIEKNLKIIFLAVFILLVSPSLISANCGAICETIGGAGLCDEPVGVGECNTGVTPGCCGCFRQYFFLNATDVGGICKAGASCFAITDKVWYKSHKFPDTGDYNGRPCAAFASSGAWEWNCVQSGGGFWDASERKCVQCNGKFESKLCGSASCGAEYPPVSDPTYCISLGCNVAGNGKCETACDAAGVDPECDDYSEGHPCGIGGTCDANCQCILPPPVCSWQDDACGAPCPATERHQTCGPAGCSGGICIPGSTRCIADLACLPCEDTCTCTCPAEIPCPGGECRGGLVPCGRSCDDPCTKICECAPCTLCHLFVLFKRIVDFLTLYILFPLAVLMIVVGGVMFLTAGGDSGRIGGAKKILTATVIGLVIILAAWLIVDTVITFLTPAASPLQNWSTINCPICGDGDCDSGETPENCPDDCEAPPPACNCAAWINDACGVSGCAANQMHQTRTCNPVGCASESQCIADPACAAPPPVCSWQDDACGAPCVATDRHQTCGPAGCSGDCGGQPAGSTHCIADPACAAPPPVCSWQDDACGAPCAADKRHQTCGPIGCSGNCDGKSAGDTQCIADPSCVSACGCLCDWCPAVLNPPCP